MVAGPFSRSIPPHVSSRNSPSSGRKPRVTAVANLRGGVGKTTTAVNLAAALARGLPRSGKARAVPAQRVALIDTEPLAAATGLLRVDVDEYRSSAELFRRPPPRPDDAYLQRLHGIFVPAGAEPFVIAPSAQGPIEAANHSKEGEFTFRENLALLGDRFQHVVVDLPATLSDRVFRSVLNAADGVLIPMPPSTNVIATTRPLLVALADVQMGGNPGLRADGYLLNRAGRRGDLDAELAMEALTEQMEYPTFRSVIRDLKPFLRMDVYGGSVFAVPRAAEAQEDFAAFVREWYAALPAAGTAR